MPKKFVTRKKDVPVATPSASDDSSPESSPGGLQTQDVEWPSLTKADLEQFAKKFAELDVNGDGTLSGDELGDVMRDHNAAMSELYGRKLVEDELGDIWELGDADGSGEIDPDEFVLMMYLIRCASDGIMIPKSAKAFPPGQFPPMAEEPPEKEPKKEEPKKEEPEAKPEAKNAEDASVASEASGSASAELARLQKAHAALTKKLDAVTESAAEAEAEHLVSSRQNKTLQKRAEKAEASLETLTKKLDKAEDRAEAAEAEAKVLQRRFDASETARKEAEAAKKAAEEEAAEAKREEKSATAAMASKGNEQTKMLTARAEQAEADEEKARRAQTRAEADAKAATARAEAAEAARAEAEAKTAAAEKRAQEAELDAQVREESAEHANQDAEVEIKKRRLAESARDVAALRATAADERADKAEAAAAAAARAEEAATSRALAALAAMRRVAHLAGDKLAQRDLIRGAQAEEEDEHVDESVRLKREELFSLPPPAPEDAEADVADALAATVRSFQAHLVDVVDERKRLRETFGASLGSSGVSDPGSGHRAEGKEGAGGSERKTRRGGGFAWGEPPSRSNDPEELRAELERLRRYAARLQRKREEAERGALESENAAARAKEERDALAREERARANAAEQDLDTAVEKFRVLRAEVTRLREDAENLRMVNRALSRELYGGALSSNSHAQAPRATPSRGDLRREFESDESAANAFLRESGVAAAAMEGVGALEGSAAKLGGRWRENAAGAGARVPEVRETETDALFSETEEDVFPRGEDNARDFERDSDDGVDDVDGETEGSLPPVPSDSDLASAPTSVAERARAFHPAAPVSASQAMASAAKQAKEATTAAAAAMAASAAASASSLRFAESRRHAARGDAFSHFPAPQMQKGSEWRPISGALTSSGTVHVRSVAVLRQTHPGGTFGPPKKLFGDENKNKSGGARRDARGVSPTRAVSKPVRLGSENPDWFLDARFAYDERVAEARAATAARLEAAEAREAAKLRALSPRGARLPARLRPREDAPTAEDVDKAVKRFVKIFAENGVSVRLTRQAPFKYVLEQAGVPDGAFGARPAKKMLMLKLEQSRLVVHRGGAVRGAGAGAGAPAADLVDEIAGFAAPAMSGSTGDAKPQALAPGLGKDKTWLESAKKSGPYAGRRDAASSASRAHVSHGAYNVASDMTFMPAPEAPTSTSSPPRTKEDLVLSSPARVVRPTFESETRSERRKLDAAFAASGSPTSGAKPAGPGQTRTLPTGPRPFLRDDAPDASPVRMGAPAPAVEKPKAKPAPAPTAPAPTAPAPTTTAPPTPPPPAAPKPVPVPAPKPVATVPAPAAPKPAAPKPAVSAAAPAFVPSRPKPKPKPAPPGGSRSDDWDLP